MMRERSDVGPDWCEGRTYSCSGLVGFELFDVKLLDGVYSNGARKDE